MFKKFLKIGLTSLGISLWFFVICAIVWKMIPIRKRVVFAQNYELACKSPLFSIGAQFEFRNPATSGIRQYFCIDSIGQLYINGVIIFPSNIAGFIYVDGIKYPNLSSAIAALPATGGTINDCLPEILNSDPFAAVTKSFHIRYCTNTSQTIGTGFFTNVPLRINHNGQVIEGDGPNNTIFSAGPSFPINSYIFSLGQPFPGIYGSYLESIAITCGAAPVVGCGGVNFDGVQELSGGVRFQVVNCTTTTGCIRFSSDQGGGSTQDTLIFNGLGAIMFTGTNQSCVGPVIEIAASTVSKINIQDVTAIGVVGGCGGPVTPAGIQMDSPFEANINSVHAEQVTSAILSNTTANVQITQVTGHTSVPNVFTNTVAGGNWNVNDLFASGCTGNTLNDTGDSLFAACPANVTFETRSGVTSPSTFGTVPTIGWVMTVPNGSGVGFFQQLLAGFTGGSKAYALFDPSAALQYAVTEDGRVQFRGNQSGAFTQVQISDVLTNNRNIDYPNGASASVLVASLVTTAAASDNVAIQGMTSTGHCSLTATNAAAAAATLPSVTTKIANQITVTHAVTANMNYDIFCTSI